MVFRKNLTQACLVFFYLPHLIPQLYQEIGLLC